MGFAADDPGFAPIRYDAAFGDGGAAFCEFTDRDVGRPHLGPFAQARAVVVRADGHVLVGGTLGKSGEPTGRVGAVVCFDQFGRLDEQFGTVEDGRVRLSNDGADYDLRALALQADGRLIIAATRGTPFRGGNRFDLRRLTPSGEFDSEFGEPGQSDPTLPTERSVQLSAVALQPDGSIIAAGHSTDPIRTDRYPPPAAYERDDVYVARYKPDGGFDSSFGPSRLHSGTQARAVALDGRVFVAGYYSPCADVRQLALACYDGDGKLDRSFGAYGATFIGCDGADECVHAMAVEADGRILITGSTARDATSEQHFLLARFDQGGRLNWGFGETRGGVTVSREFVGVSRALAILPDGRVITAGSGLVRTEAEDGVAVSRELVAVACHMPDGEPDRDFGDNGVLKIDLGGVSGVACGIALHGQLVYVAATSTTDSKSEFALIRLLVDQ